ncbi:hypothetical protein DSECCO2_654600 [anaerobic digester metagenome]
MSSGKIGDFTYQRTIRGHNVLDLVFDVVVDIGHTRHVLQVFLQRSLILLGLHRCIGDLQSKYRLPGALASLLI